MPTDLPLSRDDIQAWWRRVKQSKDLREKRVEVWKSCVQSYLGKPLSEMPEHDTVVVNKSFPFLEQKRAQLLFQVPEVHLKPKFPGLEQATLLFQSALNHELGPDGADVKNTLDELLFDALSMGIGFAKIGYGAVVDEKTVTEPAKDPMTGQPMPGPPDPFTGMPGPPPMVERKVPYLVHEEYFWRRISPDKALVPAEFEGLKFDEAGWLAFEWEKPFAFAQKEYDLPEEFSQTSKPDLDTVSGEKEGLTAQPQQKVIKGIELWYYASRYDPDEPDPERVRRLVLIEGVEDRAVRHTDSPYQRPNALGKLTGMKGLPIHVLTLRGVAGSAYPPSDIEISLAVQDEMSKGRTQMVLQRETSIPMRWADRNRIEPQTLDKVLKGHWQAIVPTDGNGNEILGEVARANFPRENFTFMEVADREYEELWALSKPQRGLTEDAMRTATELQIQMQSADVRLDAERTRVLTYFTTGCRKFGALLQLFKTDEGYVEILGQQAEGLKAWNRDLIQGEFLFTAKPDSALRIDAAVERKQKLDLYNMLARDPNVSRVELLKSLLLSFNMDPSRIVVEQLPTPGPEPPKVNIAVRGEDLGVPSPLLLEILKQYGIQISPEQVGQIAAAVPQQAMQQQAGQAPTASPPHQGPQEQAQPLLKHNLRGDGSTPAGVSQRPGTVQ